MQWLTDRRDHSRHHMGSQRANRWYCYDCFVYLSGGRHTGKTLAGGLLSVTLWFPYPGDSTYRGWRRTRCPKQSLWLPRGRSISTRSVLVIGQGTNNIVSTQLVFLLNYKNAWLDLRESKRTWKEWLFQFRWNSVFFLVQLDWTRKKKN